jgi:hypothetical protein
MRTSYFAVAGLLVAGASVLGGRAIYTRAHSQAKLSIAAPSVAPSEKSQTPATGAPSPGNESEKKLGPFSIASQNYTVELRTRKVQEESAGEGGDTVVAMEIRDAAGAVQYQRVFPYVQGTEDSFESWSVSALPLTGTNGAGLLVSYDDYFEPSAPEEEPSGWFQMFGVLGGKLVPFGAPLEVQGGLLDEYVDGNTYKTARSMGAQTDEVDFKMWTGHCRIIFPIRVDWNKGKLAPAQDCAMSAGELSAGCQYKVVPETQLYTSGITFVRLWANPNEKSGAPQNVVVKKDSKVDLLSALAATKWVEGNPAGHANTKGPVDDAGSLGVDTGADLWIKVRIDGKEGWMHSEEDFHALGLPEDE